MQWILHDVLLGQNMQTIRMNNNLTQMQVVKHMPTFWQHYILKYIGKY
ncbi:hypothetical protein IMSAGC011_01232 [Lachnospiraceae bacterium]|nr:hypothetical protein IMSAGC011_01232 [Lachnospiraceae bacterium]